MLTLALEIEKMGTGKAGMMKKNIENERIMTEECSEQRALHEACGYYGPQM